MKIKALSLWQPWASLITVGAKKIETRSWGTAYRGWIAIHAAKTWDSQLADLCLEEPFRTALWGIPCTLEPPNPADLPRGAVVGLGRLHRCLPVNREYTPAIPKADTSEYRFGDYSPGRFMWIFDEVWRLRQPVLLRGRQGLWTLEDGESDAVLAMLPDEIEELLSW